MSGVRLRTVDEVEVDLGIVDGRFTAPSEGEDVLDWRHLWALPGLVDSHAHLAARVIDEMIADDYDVDAMLRTNAAAQLDGGVLLVADKGSRDDRSLAAADWAPEERPELQMAGGVIAPTDGYYPEFEVDVAGSDLPAAVERACVTSASWVKLIGDWPRRGVGAIPNYAEDELRSAVAIAHAHNRRVAIHTAAPETPSMAVAAGVDSIEHGLFLTGDDVRRLGARGGAWVPTLCAMRSVADQLRPDSSGARLFADGLANATSLLGPAIDCGVYVLAGSDLYLDHGSIGREALALAAAGLSHVQALAAVTTSAHGYFGSDRGFTPGSLADVVVFEDNPISNLETLLRPAAVMRLGRVR